MEEGRGGGWLPLRPTTAFHPTLPLSFHPLLYMSASLPLVRNNPSAVPTTSEIMHGRPACALCGGEAALFCEPDAAFLCWPCDASVHAANFLVARHVRLLACAFCRSLDARCCVSGPCPRRVRHLCPSCDRSAPSSPCHSSSSSSSCLSTSDSTAAARDDMPAFRRRRRRKAEGTVEQVLLTWGRRIGLRNVRQCVDAAARAVGACGRGAIWFPSLRVTLAGALWFALNLYEDGAAASGKARAGKALLRLEACSGVPARFILVAESRIARVAGRAQVPEESWAECS